MAKLIIVTCCKCGAQYERTLNRAIVRDQDSFECFDCGETLDKWSSSVWPSFRKIKDGTVPK